MSHGQWGQRGRGRTDWFALGATTLTLMSERSVHVGQTGREALSAAADPGMAEPVTCDGEVAARTRMK